MKKVDLIINGLDKLYPDAHCELNHRSHFELLIAVVLSAQTTDERVNSVTPELFNKYPDAFRLAKARLADVEKIIKPIGLYHNKAINIIGIAKKLAEDFAGEVPEEREKLESLPGVGRKSANLIMGDVFGKPAIVTDTHCIRLCNLIGLVDGIKDPAKVERELWKIVPAEEGNDLCHRFVLHGRAVCVARRPRCAECCLKDICRYGKNDEYNSL